MISSNIKNKINLFFSSKSKRVGLDLLYFVNNGSWLFLKQLIGGICGLLLSVAFARMTTKEIFGQYQLILSIFSIVSLISIPGLNISVARSVARGNDGDYKNSVKKSFFWSLFGIPVLWITGVFYYLIESHIFGITLMLSGLFFPFFYAPNNWGGFLMGKSKFDVYTKFNLVLEIASLLITIAVIYLKPNNLIAISLAYFTLYSFFNVIFYFKTTSFIENNKKDPDTSKYGWFLTFNYSIELIAENINRVIVGIFLSPTVLAIYSIVSLIPVKFRNIFKPFLNILFPKMTSDKVDIIEILKKNKKVVYILSAGMFILGAVYFLLIEKISRFLFGSNYADYYYYGKYFVVSMVLNVPILILTKYIQAKKMERAIFYTGPVFLLFRTILTIIMVYYWNLLGAVMAFNIGTIVRFFLFLIFLIRNNFLNGKK